MRPGLLLLEGQADWTQEVKRRGELTQAASVCSRHWHTEMKRGGWASSIIPLPPREQLCNRYCSNKYILACLRWLGQSDSARFGRLTTVAAGTVGCRED